MNYCTIEDAWGGNKQNQISNQYKNYMIEKNLSEFKELPQKQKNNDVKYVENFNNIPNDIQEKNHTDELHNCDSFINHIYNCRKCYNKMRSRFKPQMIENFHNIIDDHRDTIVIILIGISILLFFNLINNMTKSN
jgi:hypothetical protein